ncbi:hypothetical protein GF327_08160 [Candidatus Woesearchaeota archaeon]|nr:hypothetical protein [Candidatus Woesearchaeota archaeon]
MVSNEPIDELKEVIFNTAGTAIVPSPLVVGASIASESARDALLSIPGESLETVIHGLEWGAGIGGDLASSLGSLGSSAVNYVLHPGKTAADIAAVVQTASPYALLGGGAALALYLGRPSFRRNVNYTASHAVTGAADLAVSGLRTVLGLVYDAYDLITTVGGGIFQGGLLFAGNVLKSSPVPELSQAAVEFYANQPIEKTREHYWKRSKNIMSRATHRLVNSQREGGASLLPDWSDSSKPEGFFNKLGNYGSNVIMNTGRTILDPMLGLPVVGNYVLGPLMGSHAEKTDAGDYHLEPYSRVRNNLFKDGNLLKQAKFIF